MRLQDFDVPLFVGYQSMLRGGVDPLAVAEMVQRHQAGIQHLPRTTDRAEAATRQQACAQCVAYLEFLATCPEGGFAFPLRPDQLDVPRTREAWQLYPRAGAAAAARELGQALHDQLVAVLSAVPFDRDVPAGPLRAAAYRIREDMHARMRKYDKLGAFDTVNREILASCLATSLGLVGGLAA